MDINTLFGIRDMYGEITGELNIYRAVLLTSIHQIEVGSPCFMLHGMTGFNTVMINPIFPHVVVERGQPLISSEKTINVHRNCLKVDSKPFSSNSIVVHTDDFSFRDKDFFMKELDRYDSVTYVVEDIEAMSKIINDFRYLTTSFKYYSNVYLNSCRFEDCLHSDRLGGDEPMLVVTIFRFEHASPVFNPKKKDGFGIKVNLAMKKRTEKAGSLRTTVRVSSLLSNNKDNMFIIDGQKVYPIYKSGGYEEECLQHGLKSMIAHSKEWEKRQGDVQTKTKAKAKKKKRKTKITNNAEYQGLSAASNAGDTSTTTSSYYAYSTTY